MTAPEARVRELENTLRFIRLHLGTAYVGPEARQVILPRDSYDQIMEELT